MDRIYMNRIPGSERIHVEIAENEVADLLDDLPTEDPEWFEATKKLHRLLVQASSDFGHTHRDTEAVAAADAQPVRGELWSLLDWTFWGSGMGDVFREPLADTMLAAISPAQRKQAEQLMAAWHASGRQPLGRRRYEELNAELKAAQQAQKAVMRIVNEYVIESNDVGGIDANDLVDRLADAGFPLPEDEPATEETTR